MALRIRIEHGQDAGKTMRLGTPGRYRFGRQPGLAVQVLDMKVSKEHFDILIPNGTSSGAGIKDLGSSHGTWLNGQKVNGARPLVPGDEIRVGMTVIRVMSDGPADSELKGIEPVPTEAEWAPAAAPTTTSPTMTSQALSGSSANALAGSGTALPSKTAANGNGGAGGASGTTPKPAGPPDPLVGTTLAGYKIIEKVGAGGMGSVYKSEQLSLHREVALKVLAEKLVSDSAFVDQFVNEARAAGALNHPNVVQVYDVGMADGRHYFSMEYIHGGSLEERVKKPGKAKWQDALPWFLDAANALIFAEKKGILHRDIKPDNLMLGQDGTVKLCDLGLAKKSESADLLAQGIIGTPHFIAPEAIRRKVDVDKRADLYSLGCTFFRILTGKNPYPAASVKEILLAHLNQPVPHVTATAADVPKEIDEVVFKLMQKEQTARFQGADEVWKALDKIRLQHGMEAHGLHPGRAKKFAIAGAVVAVAAIGVVIYVVTRPKQVVNTIEIRERPGVVYTPGASPKEIAQKNAQLDLAKVKSDASDAIGKLEDGENWKDKRWSDFVKRYRDLAKSSDYKGFEEAKEAAKRADDIEAYRKKMADEAEATANARAVKEQALADVLSTFKAEFEPARVGKKWIDAAAALSKATKAVDALADEKPLYLSKEKIDAARKSIKASRDAVILDLAKEFGAIDGRATSAEARATPGSLSEADLYYKQFLESVPDGKGDDELSVKIAEYRSKAETGRRRVASGLATVTARSFLADERDYWALLQGHFGTPGDETGTPGLLPTFRFVQARDAAQKAAPAMRTEEYKALASERLQDDSLLVTLFAKDLIDAFAKKPWDDKVKAEGMTAPAKIDGFTAEGFTVTVSGKTSVQLFGANHVLWVIQSIFYGPKGEEHFSISADGHEALGALAEAAGIVEPADTGALDLAIAEYDKAANADPARADRMEKRKSHATGEKSARKLADEPSSILQAFNAELDKFDPSKLKEGEFDKVKNALLQRENEFKESLNSARKKLDEFEQNFASTYVAAVMATGKPPSGARYAGEKFAAPPPAPATPPKPGNAPPGPAPLPPPGPAMDGAAMDGAGMAGDPPK